LGDDQSIYVVASTDGVNFSSVGNVPRTPAVFPYTGNGYVAYPPTLAAPDVNSIPQMVFTTSIPQINAPNKFFVCIRSAVGTGPPQGPCGGSCRSGPSGAGPQGGLGFLPGETLVGWISSRSASLDVNGGNCVAGGSTFGPYGTTGVAPAVVGFNGHAYYAWTGTDSGQHINIVQAF
jgi:hypothetical protein